MGSAAELLPARMTQFTLLVRDVRSAAPAVGVDVHGAETVEQLKLRLRQSGIAPAAASRLHLAHRGRVMEDAEVLESLREAPAVVLAAVLPTPIGATTRSGSSAPRRLALPTREQVASAWERFLPTGGGTAAQPAPANEGEAVAAMRATAAAAAAASLPDPPDSPPQPEEPEERVCRVCFCGEEGGPLLAPCRCRGSVRWVHASCLNEWRSASANPMSFSTCETCGYRYRTERAPLAAWLQSERTVRGVTLATLLVLVLLGALLPGRPHRLLYRLLRFEPRHSLGGWWPSGADRLLFGMACAAAGGVATSVRSAWAAHRGLPIEEQRWAGALLLSFAAAEGSPLLLRPILCLGLLHFARVLEKETRLHCRRLLTRFGERVLEVHESPR